MKRWATCWLLCVVLCRVAAQCPRGCDACGAGGGDLTEYSCHQLLLRTRDDGYAEIDCQGSPANCSSLPDIPSFRSRVLHRLEVTSCPLTSLTPLACVARSLAASGAKALTLKRNSGQLTEQHLQGLEDVETLIIISPLSETPLSATALSALRSLRSLRLVSASLTHSALYAALRSAAPLRYLEVSMSGLRTVPARAFSALAHLETLNLFGNQIENIDVDAFEGLSSLRELVLNSNPLPSLPDGALARAPRLRSLALTYTALERINNETLRGLHQLEQLTVQSRAQLSLFDSALSLPSVTSLSVTYSRVSALPSRLLAGDVALVNVTLAWNDVTEIPVGLFDGLTNIQRLDLSHNKISAVTRYMFSDLTSLATIDLSYNAITELPERVLSGLPHLSHVSISHNHLLSISPLSFHSSPVISLDLSYNNITWVGSPLAETDYFNFDQSPFDNLLNLIELNLSHNNISYMFSDWRIVLMNLKLLDLSYNSFTELDSADLQFINTNITVDLTHNHIRSLPPPLPSTSSPSNRILLSHNPYHCDCYMFPALRHTPATFDLRHAACDTPPSLRHVAITQLSLDSLTCPVSPDLPNCLYKPAAERIECEFIAAKSIPDPAHYGLRYVSLKLNDTIDLTTLPDYVREVNMSGLSIDHIDYVPKHIELLDLSYNKFKKIPENLLQSNTSLLLSNNPIECDCWNFDNLKSIIDNRDKIIDYDNVTCSDSVLIDQVDVYRLCGVYTGTLIGATLAVIGLILAILITIIYRYRLEIEVYLFSKGLCTRLLPEEKLDRDKKYDIFISFAQPDFKFVSEVLMPVLDREYKVCVHYRDWAVGGSIPEQIYSCVSLSRRTLAVVSEHSLQSTWAVEELRAAHAQQTRDGRRRVITILIGKINPTNAPTKLRNLLTNTTYIHYEDSLFWERLRRALPRSLAVEDLREQKQTKKAVNELGAAVLKLKSSLDVVVNDEGKLVNNGFVKDV